MKSIQLVLGVALLTLVCGCKLGGGGGGSGSPSQGVSTTSTESSEQAGENDTLYIAQLSNDSLNETPNEEPRQAPAAIPEPATMITLGLGAAVLLARSIRNNRHGGSR